MPYPVFDTNIIIDWLRERPEALAELASYDEVRISRITWSDVLAGEPLDTRPRVEQLLERFTVIELDVRIESVAADVRHRSRVKLLDAFIYATAQVDGVALITRNTKDFPASTPGVRIPYTL